MRVSVVCWALVVVLASSWFLFTTAKHFTHFKHILYAASSSPPLLSKTVDLNPPSSSSLSHTDAHSSSPKCLPVGSTMPTINSLVPSLPKGKLQILPSYLEQLKNMPSIPRIIHLAWNDRAALKSDTELAEQGVKKLLAMNQDWKLNFADDKAMDDYIEKHLPKEDWELLRYQHVVERADVWRLLVVYHEGGFYQDMDRVYNRPLSTILKPDTKMLLPVNCNVNLAQDLMCSAPCNDIHRAALELNLQRRRAFASRKTDLTDNMKRSGFNRTRRDILQMGPVAYFNAATYVLFGQMLKYDKDAVNETYGILKACPYIETFCEARCSTITHARDNKCWSITRDQLHKKQNRSKWLDEV